MGGETSPSLAERSQKSDLLMNVGGVSWEAIQEEPADGPNPCHRCTRRSWAPVRRHIKAGVTAMAAAALEFVGKPER